MKKDEENIFGIYKENYHEKSIDWILILNDQVLDIYKAEGLRNFPLRNINVYMWNRVKMNTNPVRLKLNLILVIQRDFYGSVKIISASCRDFNDIVSMYTLNGNG